MDPNDLKKAVEKERNKIKKATAKIHELQSQCLCNTEPGSDWRNFYYPDYVKVVHKSDTGNWCKSDDSYWIDCDCSICGRHWVAPQ